MNVRQHLLASCFLVGTVAAGCADQSGEAATPAQEFAPSHVDSIFPIEEEMRRFRTAVSAPATRLEGGAGSRDELVEHFLAGLEAKDVERLLSLTITPGEFIDLYYPTTRFTAPPYELSPSLVWFQLENYGSRGMNRALARFGGKPLGVTDSECAAEPEVEGENRVWSGCYLKTAEGEELSLFGQILEREGRFKFINFANRL